MEDTLVTFQKWNPTWVERNVRYWRDISVSVELRPIQINVEGIASLWCQKLRSSHIQFRKLT